MVSSVKSGSERSTLQRELEINRREKELVQRKLKLAKREIELLRGMQRLNVASGSEVSEENQRTNILANATATLARAMEIPASVTEISARAPAGIIEMAPLATSAHGVSGNEAPSRPIAKLLGSFDG